MYSPGQQYWESEHVVTVYGDPGCRTPGIFHMGYWNLPGNWPYCTIWVGKAMGNMCGLKGFMASTYILFARTLTRPRPMVREDVSARNRRRARVLMSNSTVLSQDEGLHGGHSRLHPHWSLGLSSFLLVSVGTMAQDVLRTQWPSCGHCAPLVWETPSSGITGPKILFQTQLSDWTKTGGSVVRNPPANAGDVRDTGSIPGLGRSPGGGNGDPLQYSCLENLMDRGAWWAIVHGGYKESDTTAYIHRRLFPSIGSKQQDSQLMRFSVFASVLVSSVLKNKPSWEKAVCCLLGPVPSSMWGWFNPLQI